MRFDVSNLRYFSRDDFRVLTALEMGMRNHDLVPTTLIGAIAGLRHGGVHKILSHLLQNKLIVHERKLYDGYRLTYPGYDFLALKALLAKKAITGVGRKIGVGKESDIYLVTNEEGELLVLKLERLGRTSFRAIKRKRDYMQHRKSASWLYMSRLAALKEFAFMSALHDAGFPTPKPVACNRHAIVMSLVPGVTLSRVHALPDPAATFAQCMDVAVKLAASGLVHCDFNQFNIMYVEPAADAAMASGRYRARVFGEDEDEEGPMHGGAGAGAGLELEAGREDLHAAAAAAAAATGATAGGAGAARVTFAAGSGSGAAAAARGGAAPRADTKLASGLESTAAADRQTAEDKAAEAAAAAAAGAAAAGSGAAAGTGAAGDAPATDAAAGAVAAGAHPGVKPAPGRIVMIDFPQMVSVSHPNAAELFNRDVRCILNCFERKFGYRPPPGAVPSFASIARETALDVRIEASGFASAGAAAGGASGGGAGFSADEQAAFEQLMGGYRGGEGEEDEDEGGEEESEDESEGEEEEGEEAGSAPRAPSSADAAAGPAFERGGEVFVGVASTVAADAEEAGGSGQLMSEAEADAAMAAAVAAEEAGRGASSVTPSGLRSIAEGRRKKGDAAGGSSSEEEGSDDDEDDDDSDEEGGGERGAGMGGVDSDDDGIGNDTAGLATAEREAAVFDRPPDGLRTRANGRRVKTTRGGEAYLRNHTKAQRERAAEALAGGAAGPSGPASRAGGRSVVPRSVAGGSEAPDADVVRSRVKHGYEKEKRRTELSAAASAGAGSARSRMKDRESTRVKRVLKEASGMGHEDW